MTRSVNGSPSPDNSRLFTMVECFIVVGLLGTLIWTTLCLGGYLAATMLYASWAVFGLATLGVLLWIFDRAKAPRLVNLAMLLPLPFLLYALVSVHWLAPAKWLAWREWLLWFQMWLVFVLALHFGRGRGLTRLMVGTFVLLGVAGAGMAVYQRFGDPAWMMLGRTQADQFVGRSSGMFGVPNSLAGLMELMVPLCLLLVFTRNVSRWVRGISGMLGFVFIVALIFTGSRGGWLSVGCSLFLLPLLVGRKWKTKLLGVGLLLAVFLMGFGVLYQTSSNVQERIRPFLEGKFESSRPIIWKAGWEIWRDHPWLGSGAASYNVVFDQYRPRGFLNEPDWTHNDYLNTLSDYGVVGFALWAGAGLGLFGLGWRTVRNALNAHEVGNDIVHSRHWRLGLFLGLLAFAIHLLVDFHTKLPALAFASAIGMAMLIREEPTLLRPINRRWIQLMGLPFCIATIALLWWLATPLYRAEALRYEARRALDRFAINGQGDLTTIALAAKKNFRRAVSIDPGNGQAWADLSYATLQSWAINPEDLVSTGRFAELAADEAVDRCAIIAEFWVRKGVSLGIQQGRPESEACYRTALELAPNTARWWYHYAYHLKAFPDRKREAQAAIGTCLALDPYYPGADAFRQQLGHQR